MKKNKKDYKQMLNDSFASVTPEQSEELKQSPIIVTEAQFSASAASEKKKRPFYVRYRSVAVACMCLVVAVAIVLGIVLNQNPVAPPTDGVTPPSGNTNTPPATGIATDYKSYITVSINPAFSLAVGSDGIVENVVADNYDGEVVLKSISADHVNLRQSYEMIIKRLAEYAKALGYYESSQGIQIDIYNYHGSADVKEHMKNKIRESMQNMSDASRPLTVTEMNREKMYGYAKEVLEDLAEDMEDDDLFAILKNKHGYGDRHGNTSPENEKDIYDLFVASYVMKLMDQMSEMFEELNEYMENHGMTPEMCLRENDLFFLYIKEYIDKCLLWTGDDRTLTAENYDVLAAECESGDDDLLEETVDGLLEGYRGNPKDAMEDAEETLAEIMEDADAAAWIARMREKYPMTDAPLMQQITELERDYRGLLYVDGLHGMGNGAGHGNSNNGGHGMSEDTPNEGENESKPGKK